jgi:phenylacetate-CoA ligase
MLECWKAVLRRARRRRDRIFFPFSFGPFLGFWTRSKAGCQIGAHCIPPAACRRSALSDDRNAAARRRLLHSTYALRLLEVAARCGQGLDLSASGAVLDCRRRGGWQHSLDAAADLRRMGSAR